MIVESQTPEVIFDKTFTPEPPVIVPTLTMTPIPESTDRPTNEPKDTATSTRFPDGSLNCPGSVALMYHHIDNEPSEMTTGIGLNTTIDSFSSVLDFLVDNNYYFPTPKEFAEDVRIKTCRHKYAIVIIDDSWNDPEKMGVIKVLIDHGGETSNGKPKIWLAVVTRMLFEKINTDGNEEDPWTHLHEMHQTGVVEIVSHSQTHPVNLKILDNIYDKENDPVYAKIAQELSPSRQDIIKHLNIDPYFFVYPGGNVSPFVMERMGKNYTGGFSVSPGGLNRAFPYFLPRINGGQLCMNQTINTAECVIETIKKYSISN